tara:strand:- start:3035 stop:3250 length:216 start_codon:yes stop_codon:yes gene_type:complete
MDEQLEKEYIGQLYVDGLSQDTAKFFREMSYINRRCLSYFVIMALEELKNYLDQAPPWDADPEEQPAKERH